MTVTSGPRAVLFALLTVLVAEATVMFDSFEAINILDNTVIDADVTNGTVFDVSLIDGLDHPTQLSIIAKFTEAPGSVVFWLDGDAVRTENAAPYAMGGDWLPDNEFFPTTLAAGNHTVVATAYSGSGGTGTEVASSTVEFMIVTVGEFILINTQTGEQVGEIINNAVINLSELGGDQMLPPSAISVMAKFNSPNAACAQFFLNGMSARIENYAPYVLFGDYEDTFFEGTLDIGKHTLEAVPYTSDNIRGTQMSSMIVHFDLEPGFAIATSCNKTAGVGGKFCDPGPGSPYNGLVVVEIESLVKGDGWLESSEISGATGDCYYVWAGDNAFDVPGSGLMNFTFEVAADGQYGFIWRSFIAPGVSVYDNNDSFMRILNANGDSVAYGYNRRTNQYRPTKFVFPKGAKDRDVYAAAIEANGRWAMPPPEGAPWNVGITKGWLKLFRQGPLNQWKFNTDTGDEQKYDIFMDIVAGETYTVEISGRSRGHALDRAVIYNTAMFNQWKADELHFPESETC